MGKKTIFTNITPLPPTVSREVAIAMLHDHDQMIRLNPLVIEHYPIKTPRDAPKDEYLDCEWQELTDRISYLPGGMVKGRVTYKACFHNLPYGLQTHVYAPMGLDIREKWSICGTLPGEPDQPRELGLNVPRRGLYIREDGEIKCNMLISGFVRKNLDSAHKVLVENILSNAERAQIQVNSSENSSLISAASHTERSAQTMRFATQMGNASFSDISRPGTMSSIAQPKHGSIYETNLHEQDPELAAIHPALRDQYRLSRDLGSSRSEMPLPAYHTLENQRTHFYQNGVAKRPSGKHFAIELDDTPSVTGRANETTSSRHSMSEREKYFMSELPGSEPATLRPIRSNTAPEERSGSDLSSIEEEPIRLSYFRSASEAEVDTAAFSKTSPNQKFDRFSTVSAITESSTPKPGQFGFNRLDNRTSVISTMTDMTTPRPQQTAFTKQPRRS